MSELGHLEQLVREGRGSALAVDAALQPVLARRDPSVIGPLLLLLRDDADDDGMWSLVHAAESFDDEPYVSDVLRVLPLLNETSSRWSETVVIRMVNSETTRRQLVKQARLAPDERRAALRSVCARIDRRNVRLADGLAELEAAVD